MKKDKKQIYKILYKVLVVISVIVIFFLTWLIYSNYFKNQDNLEEFIAETQIATYNVKQNDDTPDETLPEKVTKKNNDEQINFKELKKTNEDLYGWIKIPNTKIDYPIAQSGKNMEEDFYLNKNIYKEYKFAGTIYSQKVNKKDFSDSITILYGHNMLNGSMFNNLLKYMNRNFFNENKEFYIYTEDNIYTYNVFAATDYDNEHILYKFDFTADKGINDFINSIYNSKYKNKNIRKDITVKNSDKLIVLSTCSNYDNDIRYLLVGVLADKKPYE